MLWMVHHCKPPARYSAAQISFVAFHKNYMPVIFTRTRTVPSLDARTLPFLYYKTVLLLCTPELFALTLHLNDANVICQNSTRKSHTMLNYARPLHKEFPIWGTFPPGSFLSWQGWCCIMCTCMQAYCHWKYKFIYKMAMSSSRLSALSHIRRLMYKAPL